MGCGGCRETAALGEPRHSGQSAELASRVTQGSGGDGAGGGRVSRQVRHGQSADLGAGVSCSVGLLSRDEDLKPLQIEWTFQKQAMGELGERKSGVFDEGPLFWDVIQPAPSLQGVPIISAFLTPALELS